MPRPKMKPKAIRMSENLWSAAVKRSLQGATDPKPRTVTVRLCGDETVSEAVRRFLEAYSR